MQDMEDIVRAHGPMVYRLALASLGSRTDAEDAFQEVFLRLMTHGSSFNSEEHLKAWLIRVTVNRCRSLRRTAWFRRRAPLPENTAATPSTEPSLLAEALALLQERDRTVIHLYYYENYTTREIASLLRLPEATVRTRMARARRRLADLLKGALTDDLS